jgi:hypothetical protein
MFEKPTFSAAEIAAEEWRDIPGFEGRYRVSNLGRVLMTGRVAPAYGHLTPDGYLDLTLVRADGGRSTLPAHRAVLRAFVGPCPAGKQTGHLNGVRTDNRLVNLAYVTPRENAQHKELHGTTFRKIPLSAYPSIVQRRDSGETLQSIGDTFGVPRQTIRALYLREKARQVPLIEGRA